MSLLSPKNNLPDAVRRVVIENVRPEVDAGRFPIKRVVGERVTVTADIHADGHEVLSAVLLYRAEAELEWNEVPMRELGNDHWTGEFGVSRIGRASYTLQAWVDAFKSWRRDFQKKYEAGVDDPVELLVGARLVRAAAGRAQGADRKRLEETAGQLEAGAREGKAGKAQLGLGEALAALMERYPDRASATTYEKQLAIVVDREKARFSTWYEMFPRSCVSAREKHGTLRSCIQRLSYVAEMGFDVLYLSPIHPIGRTNRKGRNNSTECRPEDVGSPWAIGAKEGGHKTIHPQLGTLEDFRELVARARECGLEVALDYALQCSPDHPYVREHPDWFHLRPDGSIQHAENPPKKYEDIYPLNFETDDWRVLWVEMKSIVDFWIEQGVRLFRVDNPHTKPFAFWEWMINEVKREHPDVLFLAEAFTRPKVMYELARAGFTQSYTYFAWRNTQWELRQYFEELTQTEVREYFRPNLWPNTPDILTEYLQIGGRPAFLARLVLAATLGASYGIYGPAFELCENKPIRPGSEEYLNAEKYEVKHWDLDRADSQKDWVARVNRIRRENSALQRDTNLRFHAVDNEQLLVYTKATEDLSNILLVVVNLDPHYKQSGWITLPLDGLRLDAQQPYQVHDLLTDNRYLWHGERNFVELDPSVLPAHIFLIRRRIRTERDFDYYL